VTSQVDHGSISRCRYVGHATRPLGHSVIVCGSTPEDYITYLDLDCHCLALHRSYNYNAVSKECELNNAWLEVSSDVSEEEGWTWSWY
jgi:hypothetical protein